MNHGILSVERAKTVERNLKKMSVHDDPEASKGLPRVHRTCWHDAARPRGAVTPSPDISKSEDSWHALI
jgi:hypothetical protein